MRLPFALRGRLCTVRAYRIDDAPALAEIAGDAAVSRWMTARLPYPYSLDDARRWIATATATDIVENFAIEVDGRLAGGIGIVPGSGESAGVRLRSRSGLPEGAHRARRRNRRRLALRASRLRAS